MNTICAISTAQGGAIGIVRISGSQAIQMADSIFSGRKKLAESSPYRVCYGHIMDNEEVVDEVLATVFHAPNSYTGEDSVELSCHGSSYILQRVLDLLISKGCQMAQPGEYTQRAFLNGKLDLSQAEAVADLIASSNAATHRVAMNQMRGGISHKLAELRQQLLHITSLLELELDFSEEDVEFADIQHLQQLSQQTIDEIERLRASFASGNAIKNGIPVAIIGAPNVGKSTLLNQLLNDDKAIVSDIQGTTRDLIEDTITLGGYLFRFIDTAGIRTTDDTIEQLGIERSRQAAERAQIILLLTEPGVPYPDIVLNDKQHVIHLLNKCDQQKTVFSNSDCKCYQQLPADIVSDNNGFCVSGVATLDYPCTHLSISALHGQGLSLLEQSLLDHARQISGDITEDTVLITNQRHKQALDHAAAAMQRAITAMQQGLTGDLISEDLRLCLSHLSTILGTEITTDEVLGNIFKNFCIGK